MLPPLEQPCLARDPPCARGRRSLLSGRRGARRAPRLVEARGLSRPPRRRRAAGGSARVGVHGRRLLADRELDSHAVEDRARGGQGARSSHAAGSAASLSSDGASHRLQPGGSREARRQKMSGKDATSRRMRRFASRAADTVTVHLSPAGPERTARPSWLAPARRASLRYTRRPARRGRACRGRAPRRGLWPPGGRDVGLEAVILRAELRDLATGCGRAPSAAAGRRRSARRCRRGGPRRRRSRRADG